MMLGVCVALPVGKRVFVDVIVAVGVAEDEGVAVEV